MKIEIKDGDTLVRKKESNSIFQSLKHAKVTFLYMMNELKNNEQFLGDIKYRIVFGGGSPEIIYIEDDYAAAVFSIRKVNI